MGLFLTKTFQKNFKKLPINIQHQIEKALQQIYLNPSLGKKLLGELDGEYSYRIGKYRIIYFIDIDDNIWVETVSHRKDVYKKS
jgi:mRNA interferase RelE/StbE